MTLSFALLLLHSAPVAAAPVQSQGGTSSIPSVVVTVENAQPGNGAFLTPPWIAIHDGTFDTYDGGSLASVPLGGNEIESLAEDGNTAPLTAAFSASQPLSPQVSALAGPFGPLAPGQRIGTTLNVDPSRDRYFSYASMIIPSNDAFLANGNPLAHELFDASGHFVATDFIVSGDESNDAGTEVNDEIASNVAFLAQAAPNTGTTEALPVTSPSPGFAAAGTLAFPDGVLNHPAFGNADFNDSDDRLLAVTFRYVDLGGVVFYTADLETAQEIQADAVNSAATGGAILRSSNGSSLGIIANTQNLTGPITMAHLHLGAPGTNGPVIVDLGAGLQSGNGIRLAVSAADLTGPLAGATFVDFLNEVAAGNVYVNLHTQAFPAGELRGQVGLL